MAKSRSLVFKGRSREGKKQENISGMIIFMVVGVSEVYIFKNSNCVLYVQLVAQQISGKLLRN